MLLKEKYFHESFVSSAVSMHRHSLDAPFFRIAMMVHVTRGAATWRRTSRTCNRCRRPEESQDMHYRENVTTVTLTLRLWRRRVRDGCALSTRGWLPPRDACILFSGARERGDGDASRYFVTSESASHSGEAPGFLLALTRPADNIERVDDDSSESFERWSAPINVLNLHGFELY